VSDEPETSEVEPDEAPPAEEALAEDAAGEAPEDGASSDDAVDWEDLAKRKAAELENLRKQSAGRVQKAHRDGMRRLAEELLPALDNFERALAAAEAEEADQEHHLTQGIRLVQTDLVNALGRVGIEPYSPKGEAFDPYLHDAVAQQPVEGTEAGTIVEVYQQGYRFGDDVLRAAKVIVAG
jgi:molecular chaperone GrpE